MQVTPAATLRPAAAHALRLSTGNLLSVSFIIPFFLYMFFYSMSCVLLDPRFENFVCG